MLFTHGILHGSVDQRVCHAVSDRLEVGGVKLVDSCFANASNEAMLRSNLKVLVIRFRRPFSILGMQALDPSSFLGTVSLARATYIHRCNILVEMAYPHLLRPNVPGRIAFVREPTIGSYDVLFHCRPLACHIPTLSVVFKIVLH